MKKILFYTWSSLFLGAWIYIFVVLFFGGCHGEINEDVNDTFQYFQQTKDDGGLYSK